MRKRTFAVLTDFHNKLTLPYLIVFIYNQDGEMLYAWRTDYVAQGYSGR